MLQPPAIPPQSIHHPRRHAAVRTDEYLYCQLIPYIGNKRKLLPLIAEGIAHFGGGGAAAGGTFVDLFAGSTVVSRLAKTMGYRVIANDWEPYAATIAQGTVALNRMPAFSHLGGPRKAFDRLNQLPPKAGYVTQHLCPRNDAKPDPERERMFFTRANGQRIDAIREQIACWQRESLIDADEQAYLLSALIYAVSYVSNTSGLFKGFHHGWGGKTGTALYRILSRLTVRPPVVFDNGQANLALRGDASVLAGRLGEVVGGIPGVVYLDPPYNQHPYGSNYHVLNTVTLGDEPAVNRLIRVDGRTVNKSAIRTDWRTLRRSHYNSTRQALPALEELLAKIEAQCLMMSYSTDGNMPLRDVLAALGRRGKLEVFTRRYKRYRVSTPRMSPKSHNVEFLAVVNTRGPSSPRRVEELAARVEHEEREAMDLAIS